MYSFLFSPILPLFRAERKDASNAMETGQPKLLLQLHGVFCHAVTLWYNTKWYRGLLDTMHPGGRALSGSVGTMCLMEKVEG